MSNITNTVNILQAVWEKLFNLPEQCQTPSVEAVGFVSCVGGENVQEEGEAHVTGEVRKKGL